jgi:WD40 repeat protein/serine/threonine protein kinase
VSTITIKCPQCGSKYPNIARELIGKTARCKGCDAKFKIAEPVAAAEPVGRNIKNITDIPADWETGDVFLDLYKVTGLLGEGGMGKVFKVHHMGWNVDLAVKCPKPEELKRAGGSQNFQREAETWVNLGLHPNTVSCYYVRELGGIPRVFAEYVEGGSLHDWIHEGKLIDMPTILDVAIQFAWGLHFSHEKGLVHQDIKPANVMMTAGGEAKVTDFGLAKALSAGGGAGSQFVSFGGMTPAYCSPEQANKEKLTLKTDIWSWAVSILVMFTGEVTWHSGTVAPEALDWYLQSGPAHKNLPRMTKSFAALLKRCFQEDTFKRPNDMMEVAETLKDIYRETTGGNYPRQTPETGRATADSLNNRAVSLLDLGRQDEAVKLWEEAVRSQPHHPEATYNSGLVLWRTGKMTDSVLVRNIEEVQKSYPEYRAGDYLLAMVHMERDDCEQAAIILEKMAGAETPSEEVRTAMDYADKHSDRSRRLVRSFKGHEGPISSVCMSRDGLFALSGSADKTIKLWGSGTGQCLRTLTGHTDAVTSVYLTPDMKYTLSGGADAEFKIWDFSTGHCLHSFIGHTGPVTAVYVGRDGKNPLTGSADGSLKLWDVASGHYLRAFDGHKGGANGVLTMPDGEHVVSAGNDSAIRVWDVNTLRCVQIFRGHTGPVNSIGMNINGTRLLSGSSDKNMILWDVKTTGVLRTFLGHIDAVLSVDLSADGRYAVSASADKTVKLWDVSTGRCLRTFEGHSESVTSVSMCQHMRYAISGSQDNTLMLWELNLKAEPYHAPMMLSRVLRSETAFSAMAVFGNELNQARAAIAGGDAVKAARHIRHARAQRGYDRAIEAIDMWTELYSRLPKKSFTGGWEGVTLKGHEAPVTSACLSLDDKFVLSGSADKTLRLWDIESGQCMKVFQGHGAAVTSVCISPDAMYALSGSADGKVKYWDMSKGRTAKNFAGHEGPVNAVSISHDGVLIISAGEDMTVRCWEVESGKCVRVFEGHKAAALCARMGVDARSAVTGGADGVLKIWEMTTAHFLGLLGELRGHVGGIRAVSLSQDGAHALSGGDDKTVRLWETAKGTQIRIFEGHTDTVTSVCLSYDGRYALSGSLDNTFRLWETSSGICIRVFKGHLMGVLAVDLSATGRYALSASEDRTIKLWSLDWELEDRATEEWNDAVKPYLDAFLTLNTPYIPGSLARRGKPTWKSSDFDLLIYRIGCAGYGWVSRERIRRELDKMASASSRK